MVNFKVSNSNSSYYSFKFYSVVAWGNLISIQNYFKFRCKLFLVKSNGS